MILVDLHGGDYSPAITLAAVTRFARKYPHVPVKLFGTSQSGERLAGNYAHVEYVDCESEVSMDAGLTSILREGAGSTMWNALQTLSSGSAHQVMVSAGNTTALIALAKHLVGMKFAELKRPALMASMPTGDVYCTDLGANLDLDASQLHKLALCAIEALDEVENPKVALLNVGKESVKGPSNIKQAFELMSEDERIQFKGFIEPHELLISDVDLVIMDGLMGNIMLKSLEGAFEYTTKGLLGQLKRQFIGKLALWSNPFLKGYISQHAKHQAAFLVGLKESVLKIHGRADEGAFYEGLMIAKRMVEGAKLCTTAE